MRLADLLITAGLSCALLGSEPGPAAIRLARQYDAMDVEHHWLPGHPVAWRTGEQTSDRIARTHCSAFAAAACARLGIYLLHPPEHAAKNLANAQYQWLAEEGSRQGWRGVATPFQAQQLANEGQVVVAVFLNPNPAQSGHIALLRPSGKPDAEIQAEGPQIVQAGATNYASVNLRTGFRRHRGAWVNADDFQVRFYAHPIPADQ
jgi:hypothetical protein